MIAVGDNLKLNYCQSHHTRHCSRISDIVFGSVLLNFLLAILGHLMICAAEREIIDLTDFTLNRKVGNGE